MTMKMRVIVYLPPESVKKPEKINGSIDITH